MARLKVMLRGATISEIGLQTEKEYIGGRKDGSDIRLQAEKGISREHFRLKFIDGRWTIQAISRFGDIFSMGQKIEQATLDHGQSFQIPPYEFQFLEVPGSEVSIGGSRQIGAISESENTVVGVSPQVPYVKIVNSNGDVREMLRLEVGEVWVAGRDPSCQIIIPDQRVSRRQFEIHKVNGNYTVIDLASVNGTFLNGSPVSSTDPQSLKSGDAITVLDNTMYFELHDPNFKYKIDRIEVPPIAIDQSPEDLASPVQEPLRPLESTSAQNFANQPPPPVYQPFPTEIPQIQQDQINPQLNTGGGPFTGVPPHFDPNQFYTFVPPQSNQPPKKRASPVIWIIILLLVGSGGYYYYDIMTGTPDKTPVANKPVDPNDPLSALTPEQQAQVKDYYSLAEQMMNQRKYDLALQKLAKLHEILKNGYLDSEQMRQSADQALMAEQMSKQDEEVKKAKAERDLIMIEIAQKCQKLLTSDVTADQMRDCLAPMSQIDATAPEYVRLMSESEKIEKDREQRAAQAKSVQGQIQELVELFKKAEGVQAEGYAFKAIDQYKNVLKSDLPDPNKLKEKSKARIAFIQEKIADKTAKSVAAADILVKEGKLKDAIVSLRDSLVYDPHNNKVKIKIESYLEELRRQSRLLYQESIIDESYGMVDSTETKQGAKDKWKKIVEIDVDDGEYYRKAVIKLRRYGAL